MLQHFKNVIIISFVYFHFISVFFFSFPFSIFNFYHFCISHFVCCCCSCSFCHVWCIFLMPGALCHPKREYVSYTPPPGMRYMYRHFVMLPIETITNVCIHSGCARESGTQRPNDGRGKKRKNLLSHVDRMNHVV